MRTALLFCLGSLMLGCAPRADQIFTVPGRLTTGSSGAQPGYTVKLVRAKQPPTEVVADDGSLCRLTPSRFEDVHPGAWITCDWTIPSDTIATIKRGGA
jgi:hypothetical protein